MNSYLAPILVTGSRTWDAVAATGADSIAADWATANRPHGVAHLPMPARWETCAPDCKPGRRRERHGLTWRPTAGHRRNADMIACGPLVVVAFIEPCANARCTRTKPHDSHGVTNCVQLARGAGISVVEVRVA